MLRQFYVVPIVAFFVSSPLVHAETAPGQLVATRISGVSPGSSQTELTASAGEGRYYSDTFLPLRDDVRAFERDPANRYTYCIRNVGIYECLNYASDGSLRRRQHQTTVHGTGFAYQLDGDETRLLTNEHVVYWPNVTDTQRHIDGVPLGCKLIKQKLSIVDNEEDEYDGDDIQLTRVADDRALDVAVVRAKGKLRVLPYRLGRSASLNAGDVVIVRGFPLGVFQAYNTGKIINTQDYDQYKHWEHVDFIVDAQLSNGNSGSPVLALNRRTGEYELVGVFHASYERASSLNAVIAIDQLRDLMFQLKRGTKPQLNFGPELLSEVAQRARLQKALTDNDFMPYISLGSLLVHLHAIGDSLVFEVFPKSFPLDDYRMALLVDTPASDGWGKLQQVGFGNSQGYQSYKPADLEVETTSVLKRVLQRLYSLCNATLSYRKVASQVPNSRQAVEQRAALHRALTRAAAQDAEMAQQLLDLASEKAPATAEAALPLARFLSSAQPANSLAQATTPSAKVEDSGGSIPLPASPPLAR